MKTPKLTREGSTDFNASPYIRLIDSYFKLYYEIVISVQRLIVLNKQQPFDFDFTDCVSIEDVNRIYFSLDNELAQKSMAQYFEFKRNELIRAFENISYKGLEQKEILLYRAYVEDRPSFILFFFLELFGNNETIALMDFVKRTVTILNNELAKQETSQPIVEPETIPANIDAKTASQNILLLIKFGFREYLTERYGLTKRQAYQLMGTLTGVKGDTIRRTYDAYYSVKDKNTPNTPDNQSWLDNLLNRLNIDLPKDD